MNKKEETITLKKETLWKGAFFLAIVVNIKLVVLVQVSYQVNHYSCRDLLVFLVGLKLHEEQYLNSSLPHL